MADLSNGTKDSGKGQSSRKKTRTSEEHELNEKEQIQENHCPTNSVILDFEVLDCFICYERLSVPVFQCKNGHAACDVCCRKLGKRSCPSCGMPIGTIRCRAIEKVLESLKVSCMNAKYGCAEILSCSKINEHQNYSCLYEPCFCPMPDCDFVASSKELYVHFINRHAGSALNIQNGTGYLHGVFLRVNDKMLVIQEKNNGVLFIFNSYILDNASKRSEYQLHWPQVIKKCFCYEITARSSRSNSSMHFQSVAQYSPRSSVSNMQSTDFLLIPPCFFSDSGEVKLEINII